MAAACNGVFPWEPDTLLAGSISASGRHMAVRIFFSAAAKPISAAKDSGVSLALLNQLAGRGSCSTVSPSTVEWKRAPPPVQHGSTE
ncbi:hypothetical protein OPV22_009670 [Ensete ventricosum]|uniref:Uncharacterized protein n=1 Tax=Ensete ventricosum TaxID=4639 RepID=A0AAV8R5P8_ENSVE|nr:hypothetical protein OPV22_009670 [Ensete ventricosum]